MGGIGKAIGTITKPVTKVVSKITPWKDDTTIGTLANAALLAAAAYGATQYFSAANAANTTTASQMAATPYTAAGTGGAITNSSVSATAMPSIESIVTSGASDAALASSVSADAIPSIQSVVTGATPAVITPTLNPTVAGSGTGSSLSSLFGSGTTNASSSGVFSSLGSWAKENPMLATMAAAGTIQGVGGYLSAQEMAKAQKAAVEEQRRQFDAMHNYGGGLSGRGGTFKTPQAGIKQINSIPDAREAMLKIQSDPTYRQGFSTMAKKLINPDEANQILQAYKYLK